MSSSIFNDSKYAVGVGAGIPALGFIIQMMANAGKGLENVKYATFFSLFNPDEIIAGEAGAFGGMALLWSHCIICSSNSGIFKKGFTYLKLC